MRIRDIMSTDVRYVHPDTSIEEVEHIFTETNYGTLPVVDKEGNLKGVVTLSTLITLLMPHVPSYFEKLHDFDFETLVDFRCRARKKHRKVADFMIREVVTVGENEHTIRAAILLYKHDLNRLPVMSGTKVVGLVGRRDIWKALLSAMEKDSCSWR